MDYKIDRETATAELESWFTKKKIKPSQKLAQKDSVETLIEAIQLGDLVLNKETNEFTYDLLFPVGENGTIKTLQFKARLNDEILQPFMADNKVGSGADVVLAHMAALTNVPKTVLKKLDSGDKRVASSIVVFFL